jgi:hypothetical protein
MFPSRVTGDLLADQATAVGECRRYAAGHHSRLAEQGGAAGWSLENYLAALLAVDSNARAVC